MKSQPKICFIGGTRYCQPLEATSEKKMRSLQSLGELFIIGFSQTLLPQKFTQHAHFYLLPKLPLSVLRYAEIFVFAPLLALWIIFRHDARIVVTQSPYEGVAAALAKIIAGWFGKPVVLVVESHGNFASDLFSQRRILFENCYRFLMHYAACFALKRADLLRAISQSTRKQLEQWKPETPIVQFPTWTDLEVFLQEGTNNDKNSSQAIIYAGVLIPRKGVMHLINAFACIAEDFPNAKLIIIGREDDKTYAAQLKARVSNLSLDRQIQFLSEVSQKELAKCMSQALVFVLPSLSEGLGRVVVEAMATGIPAIGSCTGGIPDMITEGVNGFLVLPGDETVLSQQLRWTLEHPDETREMGHRARHFAETFFSTETYVRGYQKIFTLAGNYHIF